MKVSCTYTSIITANIFFIIFLILILFYIEAKKDVFHKKEITLLVFSFLLLVVRLFTPLEFPITYSVYITDIYEEFCTLLRDTEIKGINIMTVLFTISLCGTVIITIVKILQYKRLFRLLSHAKVVRYIDTKNVFGKTIKIPIKQMKYIDEIFIIGLLHPTIIFPENLVGKEEYIIQHELEHFKNHDLWYKLLVDILCVIYWWNPFAYIMKRKVSDMLEVRTDFSVVENISKKEKITYVNNILLYAKEKSRMKMGLGLNKSLSKVRIYSLLNEKDKQKTKFNLVIILMILLSFFIIIEPRGKLNLSEGQFTLENNNTYLVKNKEGYDIYSEGKFVGNIKKIPKELEKLKILE